MTRKEAIDKIKAWNFLDDDKKEVLETLIPEIRENEDEKIRKALITFFNRFPYDSIEAAGTNAKEALAWLEKQGEQKSTTVDIDKMVDDYANRRECGNEEFGKPLPCMIRAYKQGLNDAIRKAALITAWSEEDERLRKTTIAFLKDFAEQGYENAVECIDWLEKQGEKPQGKSALEAINEEVVDNANKVEPKFGVGDFIADHYCRGKIVKITDDSYLLDTGQGIPFSCEHNTHLWTIKDAKNGDVVVDKSDGTIGIFQSIGHHPDGGSCNDSSYCFLHCRYDDGFFYADFEHGNTINSDDLIPATKEQRDLLFTKMKEAGYKWDENEKELKKIEQKSTNKVEPKFTIEKGKWYVCNISRYTDFVVGKAYYCSINGTLKPNENAIARYVARDCFHPWTIEDAKDGDVLACENGWTCIFKCLNDNLFSSHCFIDHERWFCEDGGEAHTLDKRICGEIHPATKEQRYLLFQKMREAGYVWNADKKELEKIEQKSLQWNISDYKTWQYIVSDVLTLHDGIGQYLDDGFCKNIAKNMQEEWSKKLSLGQKSTWSKEDEQILESVKEDVLYFEDYETCEVLDAKIEWLKSIKQRLGGGK